MTMIVKKNKTTLLEAYVDAENQNLQLDLEMSAYNSEDYGSGFKGFSLSKEEALALAVYITKTFS